MDKERYLGFGDTYRTGACQQNFFWIILRQTNSEWPVLKWWIKGAMQVALNATTRYSENEYGTQFLQYQCLTVWPNAIQLWSDFYHPTLLLQIINRFHMWYNVLFFCFCFWKAEYLYTNIYTRWSFKNTNRFYHGVRYSSLQQTRTTTKAFTKSI